MSSILLETQLIRRPPHREVIITLRPECFKIGTYSWWGNFQVSSNRRARRVGTRPSSWVRECAETYRLVKQNTFLLYRRSTDESFQDAIDPITDSEHTIPKTHKSRVLCILYCRREVHVASRNEKRELYKWSAAVPCESANSLHTKITRFKIITLSISTVTTYTHSLPLTP